eukprot:9882508-Prorocentrum_lima.AAC.1
MRCLNPLCTTEFHRASQHPTREKFNDVATRQERSVFLKSMVGWTRPTVDIGLKMRRLEKEPSLKKMMTPSGH